VGKRILVSLVVVAAVGFACRFAGFAFQGEKPIPASEVPLVNSTNSVHPNSEADLIPSLKNLLKESAKNDPRHQSPFFAMLEGLAQMNGLSRTDHVPLGGWAPPDEGYAVRIRAGQLNYVVAILRGNERSIPGRDTQCLLLFGPQGPSP
jgi:hypothetical protein